MRKLLIGRKFGSIDNLMQEKSNGNMKHNADSERIADPLNVPQTNGQFFNVFKKFLMIAHFPKVFSLFDGDASVDDLSA
jgi:hypothetical protein